MLNLSNVVGLSSTIVETVSLDVDDFSESFLTCGTCLQVYNAASRSPKLLQCSHTVCLSCAHVIADRVLDDGTNQPRCPICSAVFIMPPSGPTALPPSFVVNQLLDLMASGTRRDVVPKCARHIGSELMFCETCDIVFCVECDLINGPGLHNTANSITLTSSMAAHNVVPFAIAIRRVTEIMQYKANQCAVHLDAAAAAVELEMRRLDDETERCVETIRRTFTELTASIQQRQCSIVQSIHNLCNDKTHVLEKQLALIATERDRTQAECDNLPPDVRAITARIGKLSELLDTSMFLGEPRENSFIHFTNNGCDALHSALAEFGAIRTSETFPALCTVQFTEPYIAVNLRSKASILTYDANGCRQTVGGDPVTVELLDTNSKPVSVMIMDVGDGTYDVLFTAVSAGTHTLTVRIFDRFVGSSSPITFTANQLHRHLSVYIGLHQPVAVALDACLMYVLDTGNSRLAVYDVSCSQSSATHYIVNDSLIQRGATGMCFTRNTQLYIVNWRTCRVSWFTTTSSDSVLHSFDCDEFIEPTSLTVANDGTVFVADNGVHKIFVFASCGKLLRKIELMDSGSESDLVTCIYVSPIHNHLLVCDHRVRALSYSGDFLYELTAGDSKGHGQYGGVVVDGEGRYLVSRSERGRAMIQIFNSDRRWMYSIECDRDNRLRRPSGLALDSCGHVFVADLGNNCVRKFRYL